MNQYLAELERLLVPTERIDALRRLSARGINAREARGQPLPADKLDAVIAGLSHDSPVVRRCCLELLDLHPAREAIPHIVARLTDPVPRVRWHAVHALACDGCKAGESYLDEDVVSRLRQVAAEDSNDKVRHYAQHELERRGCAV